jgi:hypothetical protein
MARLRGYLRPPRGGRGRCRRACERTPLKSRRRYDAGGRLVSQDILGTRALQMYYVQCQLYFVRMRKPTREVFQWACIEKGCTIHFFWSCSSNNVTRMRICMLHAWEITHGVACGWVPTK